jgi:hypothetical protein
MLVRNSYRICSMCYFQRLQMFSCTRWSRHGCLRRRVTSGFNFNVNSQLYTTLGNANGEYLQFAEYCFASGMFRDRERGMPLRGIQSKGHCLHRDCRQNLGIALPGQGLRVRVSPRPLCHDNLLQILTRLLCAEDSQVSVMQSPWIQDGAARL